MTVTVFHGHRLRLLPQVPQPHRRPEQGWRAVRYMISSRAPARKPESGARRRTLGSATARKPHRARRRARPSSSKSCGDAAITGAVRHGRELGVEAPRARVHPVGRLHRRVSDARELVSRRPGVPRKRWPCSLTGPQASAFEHRQLVRVAVPSLAVLEDHSLRDHWPLLGQFRVRALKACDRQAVPLRRRIASRRALGLATACSRCTRPGR